MIKYVNEDPEDISNKLITMVQMNTGEILYPGDERRIFIETLAEIVVTERAHMNATANRKFAKNMLYDDLNEYGESRNVQRLAPTKSTAPFQLSLSQVSFVDLNVPTGTRVTADGKVFFATQQDIIIPRGQLTAMASLSCTEAGEKGNGYAIGTVTTLVDSLPFALAISNTEVTANGAEEEDNTRYLDRIRLAMSAYSTAGSEDAYKYHAMSADTNIIDVFVDSPSPSIITLMILMKAGRIPNATELNRVIAAVTPKKVRPLGDRVTVTYPAEQAYNIDITYYIDASKKDDETKIRKAIEDEGGAIASYELWQKSKINQNINPDQLKFMIMQAGANRVVLNQPAFTLVSGGKIPKRGTLNVVYGGIS